MVLRFFIYNICFILSFKLNKGYKMLECSLNRDGWKNVFRAVAMYFNIHHSTATVAGWKQRVRLPSLLIRTGADTYLWLTRSDCTLSNWGQMYLEDYFIIVVMDYIKLRGVCNCFNFSIDLHEGGIIFWTSLMIMQSSTTPPVTMTPEQKHVSEWTPLIQCQLNHHHHKTRLFRTGSRHYSCSL